MDHSLLWKIKYHFAYKVLTKVHNDHTNAETAYSAVIYSYQPCSHLTIIIICHIKIVKLDILLQIPVSVLGNNCLPRLTNVLTLLQGMVILLCSYFIQFIMNFEEKIRSRLFEFVY